MVRCSAVTALKSSVQMGVARFIRHRALDSAAVLTSGAERSRPGVARRLTTRLTRHAELQVWEGSPAQG